MNKKNVQYGTNFCDIDKSDAISDVCSWDN